MYSKSTSILKLIEWDGTLLWIYVSPVYFNGQGGVSVRRQALIKIQALYERKVFIMANVLINWEWNTNQQTHLKCGMSTGEVKHLIHTRKNILFVLKYDLFIK